MNSDFCSNIKKIAKDIFEKNSDTIIKEWIRRVESERIFDSETEMNIVKSNLEIMIADFVKFLSVGDFCNYYKSNEKIACAIAYNDISFTTFMDIFHLFEDSYLQILEELSHEDFRKYITALDRLHHKTISIISKKYFDIRDNVIFSLTKLIELRDCETAGHLERTRQYSVRLARELSRDNSFINSLYKASALHDIGKVAIRDNILLKPGKLTAEEFEEVKKHTVIGAQAIEEIISNQKVDYGYLLVARDIAMHHHEKFDGSGYPKGLKGEEIPLAARILAVVDAYDTIVTKRSYKSAYPHEEAVRRIVADAGKHFDPVIVNAFLKINENFKDINS